MADSIGELRVTPEEMHSAANRLSGYLSTMQDCFDRMKNTMTYTSGYWVGEAGDAHRQLYQDQVESTQEIIRRYQEHVGDLNQMAGVYTDAEQTAANTAQELPDMNF